MHSLDAVDRVRRARVAQSSWARRTVASRCRALKELRIQIASRTDQIVKVLREDTGKPALDALAGDIMVTLEQIRFYERNAGRILRTRSIDKPAFFFSGVQFSESFEPHGVVLIYSPYNYPFQLSVIPMVSALVAGNAVILKCSEKTPGTARIIADLCKDAGFPDDLLQVVDDPPELSAALMDARPDLVFFTGSSSGGRMIAKRAGEMLIPVILELGGKDACVVIADCNLDRTVDGVAFGAFSNAGQVCVGIKRLYIQEEIYDVFLRKLIGRVRELRIGITDDADLGRYEGVQARAQLMSQVAEAVERGALIQWPAGEEFSGDSPILLSNVPPGARLLQEGVFGPVLCIASFRDEGDAIAMANSVPFALGCSIWSGSRRRGEAIAAQLNAGSCVVNDVIRNIANPYASFGGNGMSGYGRYHGPQGLFTFSRIKSVMVAGDRRRNELHWFPFTARKFVGLTFLLRVRHLGWRFWVDKLRFLLPGLLSMLIPVIGGAQAMQRGHLRINVQVPGNSHGNIAYLVFASAEGFPNEKSKALKSGFTPMPPGGSEVSIDAGELPDGRYAVSLYQDVNGNGKLDMGVLGVPKEPVGASNNPKARMGPPRFEDCVFTMSHSNRIISILLVHE
jgi:4,4'-diapolycopenoate synthase